MKKTKTKIHWKIIIPLAIIIFLLIAIIGMYNGLVSTDEGVNKAWGDIESTYQRRADLIPNLLETVKGYMTHESDLLQAITNARSAWTKATSPKQQMAAAGQMDGALSKLLLVAENYPDLKASQNFLALQDELAGTENRINVARQRYNQAVKDYNIKTRKFPTNIMANLFNFEQKEMFEADEGTKTVTKVEF